MKIVIDLDAVLYNRIFVNSQADPYDMVKASIAIKEGTPLTESHGRLVDMSEVIVKLMQYYDRDKTIGQCLDEVPTVIEADWGDTK